MKQERLIQLEQPKNSPLPPPMHKIGIGLMEVSDILEELENDENIKGLSKEKFEEVCIKVGMLRETVREWLQINSPESVNRKLALTEKERVEVADEMHRRKFLSKIDKIIFDRMEKGNIDVECLTDRLCMSRSTLYRRVKTLTGMSANEYIRRKRMEIAKELLIDGEIPVNEIALKVGCNSLPYFRQSFKDIYGMVPSEYLRNLKNS